MLYNSEVSDANADGKDEGCNFAEGWVSMSKKNGKQEVFLSIFFGKMVDFNFTYCLFADLKIFFSFSDLKMVDV